MSRSFDYSRIDNPFYVLMIILLLPLLLPLLLMTAIVAPFCLYKQKDVQKPFNHRP
jgi:protein-S-isoprenylcysteine O-methyltransferase Ste14